MDNFMNDFSKLMAEKIIHSMLWQQIKKEWWDPGYDGQLYIDDDENILAVNIDGSVALLNYVHIVINMHKTANFQSVTLKSIAEFTSQLRKLAADHGWDNYKIIIVTTYKLSNYNNMDFNILPNDISYFYMTPNPDAVEKKYEMKLDQGIKDFMSGDDILNYLLDRGKKYNSKPDFWGCEICGGNDKTGCLYFDPTECPKFT